MKIQVGQADTVFQTGKVNDAWRWAIKRGERQEVCLVNIPGGFFYGVPYHCLKISIRECDDIGGVEDGYPSCLEDRDKVIDWIET